MSSSLKIVFTAASAALALAPAAVLILMTPSAVAQTPIAIAMEVAVGDLEVSSSDGTRIAIDRISQAARQGL